MAKTIIKRVLQVIPVLFVVVTITFVLTRMIPGNPAAVMLGPQASPDAIATMTEKLGLDKPMLEQYADYLVGILHGNFGYSYSYNSSVMPLILGRLPATLSITLTGLVLALIVGVPIGVVSALKQNTAFDYVFMVVALVGVSMPIFWLGLMLVLFFSVQLGWLPALGMGALSKGVGDVISHMVLPCICLATIPAATLARITRSSMLETINEDYVKSLRSRGIKESRVVWKHAFKNALPPILTVVGLQLASAFAGAILTETIFSWPGLGTLIVNAVNSRDYALIQGVVLFSAVVFVFVNMIVDIAYMLINPKVNYEGGGSE
ncbi:ABC transporter permease [Thermophilibacter immobilis]|uniref:ABC transporter permease n=1 Tax=Thermophilibacter immobilis TaxID=2779519 RepID=A0A7S7M918_9ACTN|nr:ABC transporter permease [Thermophilibacter immobilis]QOY60981.1 ABC transporter permease [Thermophilibacter immobilis]